MQLVHHESFFIIFMAILCSPIAMCFLVVVMHYFLPQTVLTRYFKQPHFKAFELVFLTGFPFAFMRTVMFMGVIARPSLGQKRDLTLVYQLVSKCYRVISIFFVLYVLIYVVVSTGLILLVFLV